MSTIIDLTMPLEHGMRGVSIEESRTLERDGWNARMLHLYSHSGTHMEASLHFNSDRTKTIDAISIDNFMSTAWIVDATHVQSAGLIGLDVIDHIDDIIEAGESLLIRTDWYLKHGTPEYREALPRISEQLAQWCVEKKVRMLGVEPPSVADVNNLRELTSIHQILMNGHVIIVEGLCNLDKVNSSCVHFFAIPLKIKDGDASPVRAFCIEN